VVDEAERRTARIDQRCGWRTEAAMKPHLGTRNQAARGSTHSAQRGSEQQNPSRAQRRAVLRERRHTLKAFLRRVFGPGRLNGARISVFTKPGEESQFFRESETAAQYAWENRWKSDVYVGVALPKRGLPSRRRGKVSDLVALVALGADIDISGSAHARGKRYAPTREAALQLVHDLPLQPTFTVFTGHGLHAWWVFRRPWRFHGSRDRERAASLAAGWQATIQAHAHRRGFEIDLVGDLTRVLRVPGTLNYKLGKRVPVVVLRQDKRARYDPCDFNQFIVNKTVAASQADIPIAFRLRGDAEPPQGKFKALLKANPKFRASWHRKRDDLDDQSASGYDLSLASMAFIDGWSDQEVVNLLIAWRRKHGEDLKLRHDYYEHTLRTAKTTAPEAKATQTDATDPWGAAVPAVDFVDTGEDDVCWVEKGFLASENVTAIFSPRGIGKMLFGVQF
jgi:hypothetical protein